jgi:clan AA aspartic protease (TIGR02281 family)
MKNYPPALKDWADRLDKLIKEGEEGKDTIVLQFYPGEKHIFIEAKINDLRLFKFIVDTGSDMTSIPSSAVAALGIKIDDRTPVRMISTVAGAGIAYEVTLESIELNKQRIPYLKALIIDIPGYPDYGLLGQNFLNNFRIEIDNKNGILRLRKK